MDETVPLKTNTTALLAVFAGVAGFCFWGIGGVLAIVLGLAARAEIARSAGREGGSAAAIAGIVLGSLNVASCIIGMAVGIAYLARPAVPTASKPVVVAPAPVVAPSAAVRTPRRAPETASRDRSIREAMFGSVHVVDVAQAPNQSLRSLLEHQQKSALGAHERMLLFVVGPDCLPCNGVMLALNDSRMQTALNQVRLVRVNASDFAVELGALGIPVETVPGFALITATGQRVSDYVDGGEWDADIAQNIAPVLGAFIQGKYKARRRMFRHEARGDETAL
ncbi:MAG: DUF4190 domain-containing protein [Polyangiaceae bacterium]